MFYFKRKELKKALYVIGGIMLNGYAFLVFLPYGFVVLSSFAAA
jgi:hypothetical protein